MALTRVAPAGIGSTPGTGYVIGDSFLHSRGLNATDGYYTGIVTTQNLRVIGDLEVEGTTTTLDTALTEVDKLEVGANNNTVGVAITQSGTGDILNLYDGGTEVFSVTDGGKVKIGTTTEGQAEADDLTIATSGHTGITIRSGETSKGAVYFSDGTSGNSEFAGYIEYNHQSNYLRFGTASAEKIRIDSNGRLLLGATTAGISGAHNLTIEESGHGGITIRTGTTSAGAIYFADSTSGDAQFDGFIQYNQQTRYLRFGTAQEERLRITSSGDITTSGSITTQTSNIFYENNRRVLEVHGGTTQGWLALGATRTDSDAYVGGINFLNRHGQIDAHRFLGYIRLKSIHVNTGQYGASVLKGQLEFATKSPSAGISSTTPDMVISPAGNLGIGTDNPALRAHIHSTAYADAALIESTQNFATLRFKSALNSSGPTIGINGAGGLELDQKDTSKYISFAIGSERLRISNTGQIGMGKAGAVTVNGNSPLTIQESDSNSETICLRATNSGGNGSQPGIVMKTAAGGHIGGIYCDVNSDYMRISTSGTDRIYISDTGNIGIGYATPSQKLVVKGTTSLMATNSTNVWMAYTYTDNTFRLNYNGSGADEITVLSSGEVAIGAFTPTAGDGILQISGGLRVAGSASASDTTSPYIYRTSGSDHLNIATSGVERLRITSAGLVGIGTDSMSSALQIYAADTGEGTAKGQITLKDTAAYNQTPTGGIVFQGHHTAGAQAIFAGIRGFKANTSNGDYDGCLAFDVRKHGAVAYEAMRINEDGNVGINDTAPSQKLNVGGNIMLEGDDQFIYLSNVGTGNAGIYVRGNSQSGTSSNHFLRSHSTGKFTWEVTGNEKMCLTQGGDLGIGENGPTARLHVRSGGITAGAPSEGWPDWNADNDDKARVVALLETGGNGDVATSGHGASVVLRLGQYYDSRAVISPVPGGGASPSDQGVGHGKDLMVKGGRSDNANGRNGGRLFLTGGGGFNSGNFGNLIGDVILQPQGGYIGLNGQTNPEYPFDLTDGNNRAYFTQGSDSTMSLVLYDNSSHRVSVQAYGGQLRLNTMPTSGGSLESCMRFNTEGDAIIGSGFNEDPTNNRRLVVKDTNSILRIESPGSASGEYCQIEFKTGGTNAWIWKNPTSNTNYGGADSLNVYQSQNADIAFLTNGNNVRFKIRGDGNLQIGPNGNNFVKNEYKGSVSVTGTNNESFAFEIQGASYASGGHLFIYGTSGNVVVNVSAEIIVNHSADVTIKSMSGAYTQARIRVKTDNNARAAIYIGRSAGYGSGTTTLNWKFIPYGGTYLYTTESTNNGTDHTHTTQSGSFRITAAGGGAGNVNASGSKNFMIDHPLESLRETTRLAHAAVEGPECNTIYRGKVDLVDGTATVNIDTNSRMTEGTFVALNQNVQCFTTNETGWTAIKGSVSGNLLTITAQDDTCTDTISWMVVGERHDQDIINNRATDSEGRFIPEVTDEYDASQFAEYTDPVEPEPEPDNTEERDPTV